MTGSGLEKVSAVFQGIAANDAELAAKYAHPGGYREHNPYAADGVAGLREYVSRLPRDNHLSVARAFQDGPYVFAQSEGQVLGQGVFLDVFRLEEGLIVEHWHFSTEAAPPNQSGHTQADGPTRADPSADTARNKALVREYYETVHVAGRHDEIPRYFSGDHCIRHEPGVRDGVAAFREDLKQLVQDRSIDAIKLVLGQGDFVFIAAEGTHRGEPCAYVDLYRVEAGHIAERWGFSEAVPAPQERKNDNGLL